MYSRDGEDSLSPPLFTLRKSSDGQLCTEQSLLSGEATTAATYSNSENTWVFPNSQSCTGQSICPPHCLNDYKLVVHSVT